MWLAAKTLRKKGPTTLVLAYFKYSFALVIAQPSILEAIIKFIFPENTFRNALLLLIQYYRDSNIDYVIVGLITIVLICALVLNYFAIKVKALPLFKVLPGGKINFFILKTGYFVVSNFTTY